MVAVSLGEFDIAETPVKLCQVDDSVTTTNRQDKT